MGIINNILKKKKEKSILEGVDEIDVPYVKSILEAQNATEGYQFGTEFKNTEETFSNIANNLFVNNKPNFEIIRTFNINGFNVDTLGDKGGDIDKLLNAIKAGLLKEMTNSQEPTDYQKYFIKQEIYFVPSIKKELMRLAERAKEIAQKKTLNLNVLKRSTTIKTNKQNKSEILDLDSKMVSASVHKDLNNQKLIEKTIALNTEISDLWKRNKFKDNIITKKYENNIYNLLNANFLSTESISKSLPEELDIKSQFELDSYKKKLKKLPLSKFSFNEEFDISINDVVDSVFNSANPNFDNLFKFNVGSKDAQSEFDELLVAIKNKNMILAKSMLKDARATRFHDAVVDLLNENNKAIKARLELIALKIYRNKKLELKNEAKEIMEKAKDNKFILKQFTAEINSMNKEIDDEMKDIDQKINKLNSKIKSRNLRTANSALKDRTNTDEYIKTISRTMADEDLTDITNVEI